MRFNDRSMALLGIPDLPADAFKKEGGKIKLHGGGGGGSQPRETVQTQTSIPEYARPYVERMLGKAEAASSAPYRAYGEQRIAEFKPLQQQAFKGAENLGPAQQIGTGTQMAGLAGLRAGQANYQPGTFNPIGVNAPQLQQFQLGAPERVRASTFTRPGMAEAFMSPYQQAVTDIEKREATRASDILGQQQQAMAAQRGAFGGSRSTLLEAERQRNLGMQLGDIQARGGQSAYDRATQQFNAEQNARLQAQLANQQAGLTAGGQNLSALLGVQQLGAQTGMQAQLANQQAFMDAQRAAEQSRQFGANYGMQGIQQQLAAAGQLGQLGQQQFGQEEAAMRAQAGAGALQQQQSQRALDQAYQDFLNQRGYQQQQLAFMSDILRGVPLSQSTQQVYSAPQSLLGQVGGAGLTYLGAKQAGLFAAGGLARVAANKLSQG
jgi:hypothetical protein